MVELKIEDVLSPNDLLEQVIGPKPLTCTSDGEQSKEGRRGKGKKKEPCLLKPLVIRLPLTQR
jgi:hypothetical protein